ncbi:DUF3127 domain-containing protein [Flavobacterium chungnamense]|jgi:hypothetical protein|uniref:DUF3127 domain-containing protein n=1 Tax=Flavobacterium chungnamense TaxID=706182 RepID=A0ABP7V4X8_9FLAO
MNIKAKLTQLLPLQTGFGKNGQWRKQDIIVETEGQYPKKICISIWGDKINEKQLIIGNQLSIDFELESREFNGKWYTDVKAGKIDLVDNIIVTESMKSDFTPEENYEDDGLPF